MLLELSTIALCTLAVISVRGAIIETRRINVAKRKSDKLDEIKAKLTEAERMAEIIKNENSIDMKIVWHDVLKAEEDKIDKLFKELEEIK